MMLIELVVLLAGLIVLVVVIFKIFRIKLVVEPNLPKEETKPSTENEKKEK